MDWILCVSGANAMENSNVLASRLDNFVCVSDCDRKLHYLKTKEQQR